MEAQLRESLNAALDDMWLSLMEEPRHGVMAGVYHIAEQIEESFAKTITQPAAFEPAPRGVPLSVEQPFKEETRDDEALSGHGHVEE